MKFSKSKSFIFVVTLIAFGITAKITSYNVKADAAIKNQPNMVVRSANLNSDKVIKVPKKVQKETTKTKTSINRGGSSGKSTATPSAPQGSSSIVSSAYKLLGKPYVWGATGPKAFDCSGFTSYVYKSFGISLARTSGGQFGNGQTVSKANLRQGDLVFFNTYGSLSHVGIYIGSGNFIHAANSRTGVIISSLSEGYYASRFAGAKRILK